MPGPALSLPDQETVNDVVLVTAGKALTELVGGVWSML